MQSEFCHATDEQFELYAMGRLAQPELTDFEEHLLFCADCQDQLALTDAFLAGFRATATALRRRTAVNRPWHRRIFPLPNTAWALGLAAAGLLLFMGPQWPVFYRASSPPALVSLEATRGADTPLHASAPASKPFTLTLDLTGLQPLPRYRLEIVDAGGHPVFGSGAAPDNNRLRATVAQGLPGGAYYVRVYAPPQELLREFGLQVGE
jgi:hypothetical protein